MEVKIIKNINKLGLEYIHCYHLINEVGKKWKIEDKIKLVNLYTKKDLSKITAKDVNKLFDIIVKVLGDYKQKEIPLSYEFEGKEYELVTDYFKLPAGWFIDSEDADFVKTPELLPAFAYIEKGLSYAEIDKHENIINPLKQRAEVFKRNMTLSQYVDLTGFFLLKQEQYKLFSTLTQVKQHRKKKKSLFNGRKLYTLWLTNLKKTGKKLLA